jgi:mono/diheme cytochrome c family protein
MAMFSVHSSAVLLVTCTLLTGCPGGDDDPMGSADGGTSADSGADDGMTGGDAASSGADDASSADGTADGGVDPLADMTGEEIYTAYCAACHGVTGVGTALGYELRHPVREFATWVVRNGRPGDEFPDSAMMVYGPELISDDALDRVWDYLDAFEQPADGAGLFADYCANCHGPTATGGVVNVNISDKGFGDIQEKVREGEGGSPGARFEYMPGESPSRISDAELQLIADFIATGA